tara:strand:- start:624 stop:2192 length:1569 start_codon:yes stop_codon:yes gene_type:complete
MDLFKTTASISFFTLISRITGLVREMLIASYFGVSEQTDAFFVAFRIPNLLRRLFAEGAFSQAFIPVLGEIKSVQGDDHAKRLALKVAFLLSFLLIFVTFLGIIFTPWIVWTMTGGFNDNFEKYELTVQMTRWMFPYILFISLVALSSGVLNIFSKFKIPAITPVLLNISFIFSIVALSPHIEQPIWALVSAVVIGGICQLSLQFWALKKIGVFDNFQPSLFNPFEKLIKIYKNENVRKILTLMLPATLAVSVAQVSLIINTNIASRLESGSVSWLSYADRIMELPTALLGVALGTVLLPSLTKSWSLKDTKRISSLLDWGLRLVAFFCIPAAFLMATLAEPITSVIFHYGAFSDDDLVMSSRAITAYSVGILGLVTIKILAPGFYAQQDIKTPVKIAVVTLVLTQILNYFLVPILAHAGLALAISIAALFNASMLMLILIKRKIYKPSNEWFKFLFAIFIASIIITSLCVLISNELNWKELQETPIIRLLFFLGIILGFALLYILLVKFFGYSVKKLLTRY